MGCECRGYGDGDRIKVARVDRCSSDFLLDFDCRTMALHWREGDAAVGTMDFVH